MFDRYGGVGVRSVQRRVSMEKDGDKQDEPQGRRQ